MMTNIDSHDRTIYTISQLNRLTKQLLEDAFPPLWIEGEISNLSTPSSGHVYFTLKDETAQVRCAMFKHRNRNVTFKLEHGMHVNAFAQVSLYEGRGDYQLIIDILEDVGDGRLQKKYEELKKKLHAEGLFAEELKKSIPRFPNKIGVITSPTAAALRDVLSVHQRRFPSIPLILYPTSVQGNEATPQIIAAIKKANEHKQCDVLLLVRGGGSLEDLWCFNEELVARAIHTSHIPIICGVGHEVDFTIADFAADKRAPTPSAAMELATPDRVEIQQKIEHISARLQQRFQHQMQTRQHQVDSLRKRLRHPGDYLRELAQRLDHLESKMQKTWNLQWLQKVQQFNKATHRLEQLSPANKIDQLQTAISNLRKQMQTALAHLLAQKSQQLSNVSRALDAVSPLNTLGRGFSITTINDKVITDSKQVNRGDQLQVRLSHGKILTTVNEIIE